MSLPTPYDASLSVLPPQDVEGLTVRFRLLPFGKCDSFVRRRAATISLLNSLHEALAARPNPKTTQELEEMERLTADRDKALERLFSLYREIAAWVVFDFSGLVDAEGKEIPPSFAEERFAGVSLRILSEETTAALLASRTLTNLALAGLVISRGKE